MLGQAWEGLLTAVADQDKPDHSLAIALRQKASLLQDLLSGLETGLQHGFASVRSICFAFWHTPSVQCTLGRHMQGEYPLGAGKYYSSHCILRAGPDTGSAILFLCSWSAY